MFSSYLMTSHFLLLIAGKIKKEPHIKKPLNAFMLYMKEMRPVVQAECTLKESAAINQILGRRVRRATKHNLEKTRKKDRYLINLVLT